MTINSPRDKRFSRFYTSNRETTEVELDSSAARLSLDDGVATVTSNTPTVQNALTVEVTTDMREALDSLPDAARCITVRGSNEAGAFYAGGDVDAMRKLQADAMTFPEAVDHVVCDTTGCVHRVYGCDLPTVAAIDGPAMGVGAALATIYDLQLFRDDTAVSFSFHWIGLAIDSGVLYLLLRPAGRNVTMKLVYTDEGFGPDRALELGVVSRVASADEFEVELTALAERTTGGPAEAFTASKRLLHHPNGSIGATIKHETPAQAVIFKTDDHAEGVASFASRRELEFKGT